MTYVLHSDESFDSLARAGVDQYRIDEMKRTRRLRAEAAELEILRRFDGVRPISGHDYGSGQRFSEIARRARRLDNVDPRLLDGLTSDELVAAFYRIARRRFRRVVVDAEKWGWTKAAFGTAQAWRKLELRIRNLTDTTYPLPAPLDSERSS